MEQRPDGLKIVITRLCKYGSPGEIKTISYSTADRLCLSGYAKRYEEQVSFPPVAPSILSRSLPRRFFGELGTDGPAPPVIKVTAICPTYNRRKYLPTAIDCFMRQTYTDSELIIVDDGTESAADLVPNDSRIKYIRLDGDRRTTGDKRNICCENATGDVIIHFDDDDWSSPTRIEDQLSKLLTSKKSVLSYHNILYWNETTKLLCRYCPQSFNAPHGATFCYTREFWTKHNFDNCQVGEDTNFGRAAQSVQQISWVNAQQQMVIRAHGNNTCTTANHMGTASIPAVPLSELPEAFKDTYPDEFPAPVEGWDLFDTLVACRPNDRAGEHLTELYPIAENVARVRPSHVIVSDYYNRPDAEKAYAVTGLKNELIVTDGDKASGKIWPSLKHLKWYHGDNPHSDLKMPQQFGIPSELVEQSKLTAIEQHLFNNGMQGLALACREARLTTWHPKFRALQLLQIQANFPIMVLAAVALHAFAVKCNARVLLMSARDCCLWTELQNDVKRLLGDQYDVEYFPSSRVCRNVPSPRYLQELNDRLAKGAVIVDVGGTGKSIARMLKSSAAPGFLITKYNWTNIDGYGAINTDNVFALSTISDNILEDVNCAQHEMYLDWDVMANTDFDWKREEIRVMHAAFETARLALRHYPLPVYRKDVLEHLIRATRPLAGQSLAFMGEVVKKEDVIRVGKEKPSSQTDAVISVVRNHTWTQIAPYAVSLSRSGFRGTKLMFVDGIDSLAESNLKRLGFVLVPFRTKEPARFVTRDRFVPVVEYLKKNWQQHRNIVWSDVRDVIFQSDPSVWLERNLAPSRLLGCSESLLVKDDPGGYNEKWMNESFAHDRDAREIIWNNEIVCGGTIAGDAEAMRDLLQAIYTMTTSNVNDQIALQYLMRVSPFKEISRVPKNSEGFCATLSWQCGRGQALNGKKLIDACVFFDSASLLIMTPDRRTPFAIVHQYDRDTWWQQQLARKYNR